MSKLNTDRILEPAGYEKLTSLNSAKPLANVPAGDAVFALFVVEGADVRYRDDGTAPTITDGILREAGRDFFYTGDLNAIQFIELAASATIHVAYYR